VLSEVTVNLLSGFSFSRNSKSQLNSTVKMNQVVDTRHHLVKLKNQFQCFPTINVLLPAHLKHAYKKNPETMKAVVEM
jgi:hypothetical protein